MQAPTPVSDTTISQKSLWERRAFEKQLMNIIPDLRAFARFLAGNVTEADDLVQDTIVRALKAYDHFDLNTNIKAWTFTILRNIRINSYRKRRFEELDEATMATMEGVGTHRRKACAASRQRFPPLRTGMIMRTADKFAARIVMA